MATLDTNKRRKTAAATDRILLFDLPENIIVEVASYLPNPTCVMFAVASTAPSSAWKHNINNLVHEQHPSSIGKVILSVQDRQDEPWSSLDFGDVEKSLASRLSDDDISAILLCIAAKNKLKRLNIAGCVNITGHGLRPLMRSIVLEQIDLGMAGKFESPNIDPEPMLSEVAIQVLDTIISSSNVCSLRHITLPKVWRDIRRDRSSIRSTMLDSFIGRYNQYFDNRMITCSMCGKDCRGEDIRCRSVNEFCRQDSDNPWYGLQNHVCCQCTNIFCSDCSSDDNGELLDWCIICEKDYCRACNGFKQCDCCSNVICQGCGTHEECGNCNNCCCLECLIKCQCCEVSFCELCEPCSTIRKCQGIGCSKEHCEGCYDGKDNSVRCCQVCDGERCSECLYSKCAKNWDTACTGCVKLLTLCVAPLGDENKELKEKNCKLEEELKQRA